MRRRMFFLYIKEIFTSYRIYVSILLVGILFVISRECEFQASSLINMSYGNFIIGSMRSVAYVAAVFPFIVTFCDDMADQYIRPVVMRSGVKSYTGPKFAAGFFSAFLTLFLGFLLAAFVVSFKRPLSDPYNPEVYILYGCFVESGHPLLTLLARTFQYAVGGAIYACFGFIVSAVLMNKFITMAVPFAISNIMDIVGANIGNIFTSTFAVGPSKWVKESECPGNTLENFLYAMFVMAVLSIGIYLVFDILTEKRINGSFNGLGEGE